MNRVLTMTGVTFREAARKRVLWMALAAGGAFLILFATAMHFQLQTANEIHAAKIVQRTGAEGMLMVGMYAIDMLIVVLAVLTSIDTLSGEISSGTIQAVATKPVRRWELLFGKWLGFVAMLTLFAAFMIGGINLVTYLMGGFTAHHLFQGFVLIWLESVLLLSLTFLFGTSFSTLTNGVLALGLHGLAFIGGWIEQAGALTHTPKAVNVGVIASLIMPSEALWRRAVFAMQPPLVSGLQMTPFSAASVPSPAMIGYAVLYTLLALCFAVWRLERRDL
ncbi:MAG TPA: ABC transporter permease [Bryobacteraceae bacterium]|nr:ABC transporter permease [Bryobacteraceae bacterium]